MSLTLQHSPAGSNQTPRLSVLVPFYKDNPANLLKALDLQIGPKPIEILFYDDGTSDGQLTEKMNATVDAATGSVTLITNSENNGRSAARNALYEAARGDWVLFLDADMLPRALSEVSDCLTLDERKAGGPQYVASSNLCVRKTVLNAEPFDSGFSGWGWEDSEWAARVSKRFTLLHVDNPALHLGLETTDTLLSRFATSGPNYVRFTKAHPDLAKRLPLYNISKSLGRLPGQSAMRPLLKCFVKTHSLPMKARLTALKLWRASHYAEALS